MLNEFFPLKEAFVVELVKEFLYFCVNISSPVYRVKEIKTQAQKAARVAGCSNGLVWRERERERERERRKKYIYIYEKENKTKIYKAINRTPDHDICTRNKGRNIKKIRHVGSK